ncbi:hypothetical protein AB0E63_41185 [Kribbella sp. NPDC026596]|uniref:hypothetical protein n=1 Tax=Kribbella sp. NPDC026596 TaxID=3155122 RepID=UPI0033FD9548
MLAVFGVFVFHSLRPFDDADWHVKNADRSEGISIAIAFLGLWGLALLRGVKRSAVPTPQPRG